MSCVAHLESKSKWIHETFETQTHDHEDHTFSGVMWDVKVTCQDVPVEAFEIDSVWVRGGLGPIKVYWTEDSFRGKHNQPLLWKLLYEGGHRPSFNELVKLQFPRALSVNVGQSVGLYIHSSAVTDESIVYDNQRGKGEHHDAFITILPGLAHLFYRPFENNSPWGGSGWRDRRQFVGKVGYAVRYKLWSPIVCQSFPCEFRKSSQAFVNINIYSWKGLPLDIVMYILNMLHPNWFSGDSIQSVKRVNSHRAPTNLLSQSSVLTDLASWATTPVDEANDHEQLVVVRVLRRWCNRNRNRNRCSIS